MSFSIISAIDEKHGIGKDGGIPWHLSGDFKHFAAVTSTTVDPQKINAVVMGSRTWSSLPPKFRPLPNRLNVVISHVPIEVPAGVLMFLSLPEALQALANDKKVEQVFVIGGGQLYRTAIDYPECQTLYLTELDAVFECDTFFPEIPSIFVEIDRSENMEEKGINYSFVTYQKK